MRFKFAAYAGYPDLLGPEVSRVHGGTLGRVLKSKLREPKYRLTTEEVWREGRPWSAPPSLPSVTLCAPCKSELVP